MTTPIRILMADDHVAMREGLEAMIARRSGMQAVGEATDGAQAVELARAHCPA